MLVQLQFGFSSVRDMWYLFEIFWYNFMKAYQRLKEIIFLGRHKPLKLIRMGPVSCECILVLFVPNEKPNCYCMII